MLEEPRLQLPMKRITHHLFNNTTRRLGVYARGAAARGADCRPPDRPLAPRGGHRLLLEGVRLQYSIP